MVKTKSGKSVGDDARRRAGRPRKNSNSLDTRRRILDAAAAIFSEHGAEAANVEDIASRVGIRAPSLYYHFKNKNEIISAILAEAREITIDGCERAVAEAGPDPRDQLSAFIKKHVHAELDHGEFMPMIDSLTMRGQRMNSVLTEEQHISNIKDQRRLLQLLQGILRDGAEAGQFEFDDLTVTTFAILGPIEHLVFWYRDDKKLTPSAIADKLVVLALHSLKSY